MMRSIFIGMLAAVCGAGCDLHCDELEPSDFGEHYEAVGADAQATPSGAGLTSATLDVGDDGVVLTYETEDGARFRATYRVTKKRVTH